MQVKKKSIKAFSDIATKKHARLEHARVKTRALAEEALSALRMYEKEMGTEVEKLFLSVAEFRALRWKIEALNPEAYGAALELSTTNTAEARLLHRMLRAYTQYRRLAVSPDITVDASYSRIGYITLQAAGLKEGLEFIKKHKLVIVNTPSTTKALKARRCELDTASNLLRELVVYTDSLLPSKRVRVRKKKK